MLNESMTVRGDEPCIPAGPGTAKRLLTIAPGEEVTYHVGLLVRDRGKDKIVNELAAIALKLSEQNQVHLLQRRRLSPQSFAYYEYVAIGANR